jgi:acetylglutamate kinase
LTRVIKIGGRPQSDPTLGGLLARSIREGSGRLVIVHGGGDEVSTLQAALGGGAQFVNGRRVTTPRDIDLVRMALSGSANKRLVSSLVNDGIHAVGLSGEDASLIGAVPMDAEVLGHVGAPGTINVDFLEHLLRGGYVPVISPVSRDASGTMGLALNVNGDDAAAAIAVAMGADELLLVADVEGVLKAGKVVPRLTPDAVLSLLGDGTASGGMRAKLEAALSGLNGGVTRVRISDLAAIVERERGTVLVRTGEST